MRFFIKYYKKTTFFASLGPFWPQCWMKLPHFPRCSWKFTKIEVFPLFWKLTLQIPPKCPFWTPKGAKMTPFWPPLRISIPRLWVELWGIFGSKIKKIEKMSKKYLKINSRLRRTFFWLFAIKWQNLAKSIKKVLKFGPFLGQKSLLFDPFLTILDKKSGQKSSIFDKKRPKPGFYFWAPKRGGLPPSPHQNRAVFGGVRFLHPPKKGPKSTFFGRGGQKWPFLTLQKWRFLMIFHRFFGLNFLTFFDFLLPFRYLRLNPPAQGGKHSKKLAKNRIFIKKITKKWGFFCYFLA